MTQFSDVDENPDSFFIFGFPVCSLYMEYGKIWEPNMELMFFFIVQLLIILDLYSLGWFSICFMGSVFRKWILGVGSG